MSATQVDRFLELHTWAPREHAEMLDAHPEVGQVLPFCDECADWHQPEQIHSAA